LLKKLTENIFYYKCYYHKWWLFKYKKLIYCWRGALLC